MSRLTDLIAQAKVQDPQLGADLEREFKVLSTRLAFGLNFERHRPEVVELPQRSVRKGDKVRVLPERGSTAKGDQRVWAVKKIGKVDGVRVAYLELLGASEPETTAVAVDDLVVVAEFRDFIYPGLVSTGKVQRGGDKPFHTVINGENYHVLNALTYTHRGKIDAIYIDPPYNTGAKDWRYNNNYVEADDLYRHSKWLAMIERRLLIAKELLNPANSVLIVTIDEKEYLRLGLLLEQVFPEARIQMVSIAINPATVARKGYFGRSDEYAFVVMMGDAAPLALPLGPEWITRKGRTHLGEIRWDLLRRSGTGASRKDSPGNFYPVLINGDNSIVEIGASLPLDTNVKTWRAPDGLIAVFPIRKNGTEGRWMLGPEKAKEAWSKGYLRIGKFAGEKTPIYYLAAGEQEKIEAGLYEVTGRDRDGSVITSTLESDDRKVIPGSQWNHLSHDATQYGSRLLSNLIPGRKFPFPKSLYAVEDMLRFFVANKPNATILDFFSGSGTTAHAVMRLNRQDGGRRQCISVTNNEVAADEQKALREQGLRPGDTGWEKHGICDFITKPRVEAAITGKTWDGQSIQGDYKFTDEFPMAEGFEENAEFFTLTYETPVAVSHSLAFARIAPLLWMRAGSEGRRIDTIPLRGWDVADTYGLLTDLDQTAAFCKAVAKSDGLRVAYIVTNDDRRFQAVVRRLHASVEPVRLYESYLSNFQFANGE
ncbi:type III restriction-modification system methylation subunit [Burkholderia pseudomallei]|uniref:site-specific DNA-methyltransferase n=2 Tax=Burkholderia pseudomallei TaxID=28450 RepID=UPI0005105921|nr:DNA methyltransferase [Burkholderia pseudomallei]KGC42140.1 DNA methylase family protein [Burkholderia pseudomallei]VBY48867.1 type III restriction-modification system methylation subunit [Burkholderia pseudomallei]VBY76328.1 type III restriction-modification system methylation subunit [Burkholderia pseudomallei]VBY84647.1 type III restriction-modification system methylation subunit [Burkholderia pseudomallei]VBY96414.1 type III restriction-modification system methylation subunit [Burkholde